MKKMLILMTVVIMAAIMVLTGCQAGVSPIEDTKWILISYTDLSPFEDSTGSIIVGVIPDTEVTAHFHSETKEVRGSGGCNTYFGSYKVDGNSLTIIGPFAVTEMWCGDEKGAQESEYLDLLLAAGSFEVDGDNLIICSGNAVLNYEREENP